MTLDENLQILEDSIRRLKIEYDIFFAGAARKPPYDLRSRVDSLLKRLLDEKKMSFAQRYRYNTLVARYSSYRDLWRRLVQDKELDLAPEPVLGSAAARGISANASNASHSTNGPAVSQGPTSYTGETDRADSSAERSLKIHISDLSTDLSQVQALYNFLTQAQSRLGEKKVLPFDNFCSLIQAKTEKLKESMRCQSVTFNVSVEGDKVKFTAKPGDV